MDKYLAVLTGAAFGGLTRYIVYTAIMSRFQGKFPLGTVIVNITGCFVIGLLMPLFLDPLAPHQNWRLFLVTGVLGGYTTFSSFMWEAVQAASMGERVEAVANIVVSVVAGYAAVWCGSLITRR
jgi:fluoride exporter